MAQVPTVGMANDTIHPMETREIEVPIIHSKRFTEQVSIKVDENTHTILRRLRYDHGVNVNEWIRRLIASELPKLKGHYGV